MKTTPGNHDSGNITFFPLIRKFFYSPDDPALNNNELYTNFYSFDLGLVHYIAFNPYYLVYSIGNKVICF